MGGGKHHDESYGTKRNPKRQAISRRTKGARIISIISDTIFPEIDVVLTTTFDVTLEAPRESQSRKVRTIRIIGHMKFDRTSVIQETNRVRDALRTDNLKRDKLRTTITRIE